MKNIFLSVCMAFFSFTVAAQQNVATTGGTTNTLPKFSGSTTIVDSAVSENNGNLTIGNNGYVSGGTPFFSGTVNLTGSCCTIDATHGGYGTWIGYNGFFNGNNWIQSQGGLDSYLFTSNWHAGGWAWYHNPPTGTNGGTFTPNVVASMDNSGNLSLGSNAHIWGATPFFSGSVSLTGSCCTIDATHGGYGTWIGYNGYFNGTNWIQSQGGLQTYLFTSNWHAGGWGWFTAAPTGTNGASFTPVEVASMDGRGRLKLGGGIDASGSGIKHARAGGCSGSGGNSCSVTVSWPGAPFADTNYTAVCTPDNLGEGNFSITAKTTSSVTVTAGVAVVFVQGIGPGGAGEFAVSPQPGMNGVECVAMHD